ncbi:MAG: T9SS type A sorting domain-containing protein [Calditrichota bacterium]
MWGFNSTGNFGRPYGLERQSPDRTPGATIDYVVPASGVQNLNGGPYVYMFWWVENLSTNPNATILEGGPTATNPLRLILNPRLITQGGINGGDVAQGAFTPDANNQEIVSILFGAYPTIATIKINSLTFNKSGTATSTDISAFHLYRDGGNLGQFDSGIDILLRTYTYSGGNTISFSNLTNLLDITGDANYILVTVDVRSGADPVHTLGLVLSDQQSISLVNNVYNGSEESITIETFSNLGTAGDYSLPVTLVSFQAQAGYGNIQLEWTTASEENNDGFYIMRSEDPEGEFTRLNDELIDGSGSVTTSHNYNFTDSKVTPEVTYYYKLYSVDYNGEVYAYKTLASSAAMPLPKSFAVYQNYPNPFNPTTRLKFDVPKQAAITIEIYNMLGQKIRTLVNNEIYQPGVYDHVIWDARDDHGYQVANGIYYMVFNAKDFDFRQVRKLVFMK